MRRVCELVTSNDWDWTKVSSTCCLNPVVGSLNVCNTQYLKTPYESYNLWARIPKVLYNVLEQ